VKLSRKRITQKFPFLLPLRVAQRKAFFYAGMRLDGQTYAKTLHEELLPHKLFSADSGLYNPNTGFDMSYQENKVFNLKLAAKTLNGLLIKPGETFSFWQTVRHADKDTPYKDGLTITDGKLGIAESGGLCQMSNVLFWVLLHSPLTVVERHPHKAKVPNTRDGEPQGVDATINEGWLDVKVKNETEVTFQIGITFDSENITGGLFTDKAMPFIYEVEGRDLSYFHKNGKVYQKISIYRLETAFDTREVLSESLLYENLCEINYQLPEGTKILDKEEATA
jgi:vancomycin resistance protein VanW